MTDQLSEQTKAEQELGRKLAAENAAKLENAEKLRAAEKEAVDPMKSDDANAAVTEAEQREVFPHAKAPNNKRSKE